MIAKPVQIFQFDGYTVRPMTEQDRPYLELQIAADPYHCGKVKTDFFLKPQPGESSWALEDRDGRVIFYFKNSPVVRMHIQFTANPDLTGRRKTMMGLLKGLAWIEGIFRASLFREIIFDVDSPDLEEFARKRLGFTDARKLLSRILPTLDDLQTQPQALGTVPTGKLERVG
jgi:hypothetical protein